MNDRDTHMPVLTVWWHYDEDITSTDTTTPPTAIVPSIPPPEARPAIHKFYTRRDRNVLLIRNLGVEDKDI